jgi:hypothetical protein
MAAALRLACDEVERASDMKTVEPLTITAA